MRDEGIDDVDTSRIVSAASFQEASSLVVDFLKAAVPLGYWAVTRFDGARQLYLEVRDDTYGLVAGDSHQWDDSFCIRMLAGEGPSIAPDAMAIRAYSSAGVAHDVPIGAYVGIPLMRGTGRCSGRSAAWTPTARPRTWPITSR